MHVDDHFANPELTQATERDLQQRMSSHFHERLGTIVSKRAQSRAQAGGQNHRPRPHCAAFSAAAFSAAILSNSRCCTTTSTPFRPRRRFATCSAKYTERCCPPVHPNETIRFLKPRP